MKKMNRNIFELKIKPKRTFDCEIICIGKMAVISSPRAIDSEDFEDVSNSGILLILKKNYFIFSTNIKNSLKLIEK
jgi:hypothetical protein